MKHKAIRVDNLMYKGCEPHWKCTLCGDAVPFHCYTKKEFENRCCGCHKINCNDCDHPTEKGSVEEWKLEDCVLELDSAEHTNFDGFIVLLEKA